MSPASSCGSAKAFADVDRLDATTLRCGGGASGVLVSSSARDAGIAGIEFLRSIPGTVGGFVRMNGGAYGREVKDILVECEIVRRDGSRQVLAADALGYRYRHSDLPEGAIVVSATFRGKARRSGGDPGRDGPHRRRTRGEPAAAQPHRRLDLQDPPGEKAWVLVDAAGCRGLTIGDAQVSENIATSCSTSAPRPRPRSKGWARRCRQVLAASGIELEWEIQRVGRPA